jgi:hypothetical protein
VSVELRSPLLAAHFDAWKRVEFEASESTLGYVVRAHPDSDALDVWQLFDPTFLEALKDVRRTADPGLRALLASFTDGTIVSGLRFGGFAIADGQLEVLFHSEVIESAQRERFLVASGQPTSVYAGSCEAFFQAAAIARDIHRRLDGGRH